MNLRYVFVYSLVTPEGEKFAVANLPVENCRILYGGAIHHVMYTTMQGTEGFRVSGSIAVCHLDPNVADADGEASAGFLAEKLLAGLIQEGTAAGDPLLPPAEKDKRPPPKGVIPFKR